MADIQSLEGSTGIGQSAPGLKARVAAWLALSRLPFHSVGILPCILGMVIASHSGYAINWGVVFLSVVTIILIMLATYLAGEYYDYDGDAANVSHNRFSGGSRVLQKGLVRRSRVLPAAIAALVAACAGGLMIQFVFKTGVFTVPLGLFGLVCGFFYSARPARWACRGIGESLEFICYGWLPVNTAYYLLTGRFDLLPTLVSMPVGATIFLAAIINEFPDYQSDRAFHKKNLVVRLGLERAAWLYIVVAFAGLLSIVVAVLGGAPDLMLFLFPIPLTITIIIVSALILRMYEQPRALEALCALTLLLNLVTTLLFIAAFAVTR